MMGKVLLRENDQQKTQAFFETTFVAPFHVGQRLQMQGKFSKQS